MSANLHPHGDNSFDEQGLTGEAASGQSTAFELLELDIDLRLTDLWRCADEHQGPWTIEQIAVYLRAAYGKGYCDALAEEERGRLCSDHGFRVPEPASDARAAGGGRFQALSPRLLERFAS